MKGHSFICETKLDGERVLCHKMGTKVSESARSGSRSGCHARG
jgi:ATP-dependent DNA ligase